MSDPKEVSQDPSLSALTGPPPSPSVPPPLAPSASPPSYRPPSPSVAPSSAPLLSPPSPPPSLVSPSPPPPTYTTGDERIRQIEPRAAAVAPAPNPADPAVVAAAAAAGPWVPRIPPPPARAPEYNVPAYEETPTSALALADRRALGLPLTSWPSREDPLYWDKVRILGQFTVAVVDGNAGVVEMMIAEGLVTADTTVGVSALGLAAQQGHLSLAKLLVALGAQPDMVFRYRGPDGPRKVPVERAPTRTTLLVAAEAGHLAMVKYLMSIGADDAFIGSDGQLALRLAADNKHRDVVDFLPVRRGGAWLRWKTHNAPAVRRLKRILGFFKVLALFFVWDLPKYLLYELPLQQVKAIAKGVKWCYEHRKGFVPWCKRTAVKIKNTAAKIPAALKRAAIAAPGTLKRFAVSMAKGVAKAAVTLYEWMVSTATKAAQAVGALLKTLLSAIVTAFQAVWAAISRIKNVTFADVRAGFMAVVRTVADLPATLWRALVALNKAAFSAIVAVFGVIGAIVYIITWIVCYLIVALPLQIYKLLVQLAGCVAKGVREIIVWFNPKWQ